jgi:hypothetical protein
MEQKLKEMLQRLKSAFGQRLVSLTLYGSAAGGERDREYSDLNLLCVVDRVDARTLAAAAPVFAWWREQGQPAPLLWSEAEVAASADCFPIEYHDMQDRREVLEGRDVVAGLQVNDVHYRAQVEYQLRVSLLRLRQQSLRVWDRPAELLRLLSESVSTFVVLGRHGLALRGQMILERAAVIAALGEAVGEPLTAWTALVRAREGDPPPLAAVPKLFENYLSQIQAVIRMVDQLERD